MTSWQRDEQVAACADAILAHRPAVEAYAGHFEAQLRTARFRARTCHCLLVTGRILCACCGLRRGDPGLLGTLP